MKSMLVVAPTRTACRPNSDCFSYIFVKSPVASLEKFLAFSEVAGELDGIINSNEGLGWKL